MPHVVDQVTAFLSFTTENFRDNDCRVYLRTVRDGATNDRPRERMQPCNGVAGHRSFFMPTFFTPGDEPAR